jgi:hypothetical protein
LGGEQAAGDLIDRPGVRLTQPGTIQDDPADRHFFFRPNPALKLIDQEYRTWADEFFLDRGLNGHEENTLALAHHPLHRFSADRR